MKISRLFAVILSTIALLGDGAQGLAKPLDASVSRKQAIDEIIALLEEGEEDRAIKLLKKGIKKEPTNPYFYDLYGRVLLNRGKEEEAVKIWHSGLQGNEEDAVLWVTLGDFHWSRYEMGAGVSRQNGYTIIRQRTEEAVRESQAGQLAKALEAYGQAGKANPSITEAQAGYCRCLEASENWTELLVAAKQAAAECPSEAEFLLWQARAAWHLAQPVEALDAIETALAMNPRLAPAHALLAEMLEKENPARADAARQRHRYYEWLPPFIDIPWSEETHATASVLGAFADPEEGEKSAEARAEQEQRLNHCLDALRTRDDATSSGMLAALCYHHRYHGPIEQQAFATLGQRRAESLLLALLHGGMTVCTYGQAAGELAKLQNEEAFPTVLRLLQADLGLHGMNIPHALALYGKPEAVPALIAAINNDPEEEELDPLFGRYGWDRRKRQAILALGCFNDPRAEKTLSSLRKKKAYRFLANLALYRMQKNEVYEQSFLDAMAQASVSDLFLASWYAEKQNLPQAARLREAAETRNRQEQEKSTR